MRKVFSTYIILLYTILAQAQIYEPVKWTFKLNDLPSDEKEIIMTAKIDKGWHLYDMNLPEGGPISTSLEIENLRGAELIDKPTATSTPTTVHDNMFEIDLRWYTNSVTFVQKIRITDLDKFKISGKIEYMSCNDATCTPPDHATFTFDKKNIKNFALQNDTANNAISLTDRFPIDTINAIDTILADDNTNTTEILPIQSTTKTNSPTITNTIENNTDLWQSVIEELKALGDESTKTTDLSWLFIFLAGFMGGLLALLTPCVWPMIPMTVSFFLKRSKNRSKAIGDAIIYGLSIIVIYLVLGLLITGIFGASALNNLATNAVFNIIFFLLLVLFAVSFFGAFELVLPSSWTNKIDSKADNTTGILSIFFMAFTLVLVSFSCTGPIIGTLLVEAASQNSLVAPAIGMFGFALALAIPFALFAIFPNMLQNMPKSGSWLNSVKVVLGFLELALSLKFLSVADLAYGWHILDREVFICLWIIIFTLLGLYLLGKIKFKHDSDLKYISVTRLFLAVISFAFAVYMLPGLWGAPLKAISAFAPPLYTQDFNLYDNEVNAQFNDYDAGMQYAAQIGKPALIDFSGYGCVNCRKMEAAVWTDPRVKDKIEKDFVLISLMVDDKTKLPQTIKVNENGKIRQLTTIGDKWSYLQRSKFGANAQPFYVILDATGKPLAPSYSYNENIDDFLNFLKK